MDNLYEGFKYYEPSYIKEFDYKYIGENISTTIEIHYGRPISDEAKSALLYVLKNDELIYKNMHKKFCEDFKDLRRRFGYEVKELDEVMPELRNVECMMEHIQVRNVYILDIYMDGHAYIGFECNSSWDDEHGFGFMTFKDEIIELGHGDTSFDIWDAKDHRKSITGYEVYNPILAKFDENKEEIQGNFYLWLDKFKPEIVDKSAVFEKAIYLENHKELGKNIYDSIYRSPSSLYKEILFENFMKENNQDEKIVKELIKEYTDAHSMFVSFMVYQYN